MHLLVALVLAAWTPPVPGHPVTTFRTDPAAPYAAGQHRTLALAAGPGERVRAACAGRVTFAGRLPAGGAGVTVRCGRGGLLAGHTRLRAVAVARGARVRAGEAVGRAGAGGAVALSARRAGSGAYVDPARLLGAPAPRGGPDRVAPPPVGVRVRARPPAPPARAPAPAAEPGPARVPLAAWAGLGLLAGGIGLGAVWRARGARRAAGARARAARTTT